MLVNIAVPLTHKQNLPTPLEYVDNWQPSHRKFSQHGRYLWIGWVLFKHCYDLANIASINPPLQILLRSNKL
jgi:hypothetical protein